MQILALEKVFTPNQRILEKRESLYKQAEYSGLTRIFLFLFHFGTELVILFLIPRDTQVVTVFDFCILLLTDKIRIRLQTCQILKQMASK